MVLISCAVIILVAYTASLPFVVQFETEVLLSATKTVRAETGMPRRFARVLPRCRCRPQPLSFAYTGLATNEGLAVEKKRGSAWGMRGNAWGVRGNAQCVGNAREQRGAGNAWDMGVSVSVGVRGSAWECVGMREECVGNPARFFERT
jgi:hypothetical protein